MQEIGEFGLPKGQCCYLLMLTADAILFFARQRGGVAALRHVILLAIAGSLYFTMYATFSIFPPGLILLPPPGAELVIDPALVFAAIVSSGLYFALLVEPQRDIVDLAGFLAAGSLIAILGISFGILPAFILLLALMVYDVIAVYRTKHMVSLADVVTDMKLPILMVMPDSAGYDYTSAPTLKEQRGQPTEERAALFMGLGDVVIPGDAHRFRLRLAADRPARLGGRCQPVGRAGGPRRVARGLWDPDAPRSPRESTGRPSAPVRGRAHRLFAHLHPPLPLADARSHRSALTRGDSPRPCRVR